MSCIHTMETRSFSSLFPIKSQQLFPYLSLFFAFLSLFARICWHSFFVGKLPFPLPTSSFPLPLFLATQVSYKEKKNTNLFLFQILLSPKSFRSWRWLLPCCFYTFSLVFRVSFTLDLYMRGQIVFLFFGYNLKRDFFPFGCSAESFSSSFFFLVVVSPSPLPPTLVYRLLLLLNRHSERVGGCIWE